MRLNYKDSAVMQDTIVVIGGGRWARQYLITLSKLIDSRIQVQIVTKYNTQKINELIELLGVQNNFYVVDNLNLIVNQRILIAFIVNNSKNHYEITKFLISNNVNVLVEKPVTLNIHESENLLCLSSIHKTLLFYSNVMLFVDSLYYFVDSLLKKGNVKSISITWHDAVEEYRYGEKKYHDSSLNVLEDLMQHIICITHFFSPSLQKISGFQASEFLKHTAQIEFIVDNLRVHCNLNQKSNARSRVIKVELESSPYQHTFDFSDTSNPKILSNSINFTSERFVPSKFTPLESMIKSAIDSINSGMIDPRLIFDSNKLANIVLEQSKNE
jgi:predicted dehydrogenase